MSLSHVLLTSLLEKPSTGFELARRFDRSMGFFWNASHQQIYRELNNMLGKGWISTIEEESEHSRKKTYQVEQLGRVELADWLIQKSEPAQLREDLMVRLRAEAQLGGNQILLELERHLFLHKNKLEIYQNMYEKDFKDQKEQDRVLFIHKKILELGINLEKGWIDWLEDVIPQLQQFENS
ncbi:PadR family transcriptional regulator [Acinetobacter ursingii]|uniref:PadR family transcriptional regulator n=1 Tax=Acinetobacter ursingii TaxID=108980 RepID=UPI0021CDC73C|nr:PadR family transcriptional regulator [Acinetobacter ursingii]MCU4482061.1 PadR family transcriptional regulator [Acinetobacter ursingii]MCU4506363.1 PadR family transcriptional regulator [Acinetobacter ursingii]MCU4570711.1 PadR family transcriptional regulator [Acinetobacter ursingii]